MDPLVKLFESPAKIKLLKLFLMHPGISFSFEEICQKSRVTKTTCRKELQKLALATIVNRKDIKKNFSKNGKKVSKVETTYTLNTKCPYREGLYLILGNTNSMDATALTSRFKNIGKVDLFVASGFFTNTPIARVDLLFVGKNLKKSSIEKIISILESEIGKELTYALFETEDFLYRAHMYDKLVRDVIDFKHIKLIDRGILSQIPTMG